MVSFFEKYRKQIFWGILVIAFGMIYAYNLLTPYSSDDLVYQMAAREAGSFGELVKQQYAEYNSNNGRIIGLFCTRLSLLGSKHIFNVINSAMFMVLALLIYANIQRKKKHDIFVMLLILTFLWKFTVEFGQTMLWLCGSCVYLWACVIILGFVTFYRYSLGKAEMTKRHWLLAIGTFFFGVAAGWCNENTSGGGLLLVLIFGFNFCLQKKQEGKRRIYPFMITAVLGMICGLLGMILAPGVRKRSAVMSEGEYTGFVGLLSRLYKHTLTIKEWFFVVLVIFMIAVIFMVLQKKLTNFKQIRTSEAMIFFVVFVATCYALVVIPAIPMDRAFFGAGVFLFIACIQGIVDVADNELIIRALKYSLVGVLCMWLFFTYLENLVNLARITREENERIEIILREKETLEEDGTIVVPQYREAFKNPYSNAHASDMQEDPRYWINHFYEMYYDVPNIVAIPRDEWNELYGQE